MGSASLKTSLATNSIFLIVFLKIIYLPEGLIGRLSKNKVTEKTFCDFAIFAKKNHFFRLILDGKKPIQ